MAEENDEALAIEGGDIAATTPVEMPEDVASAVTEAVRQAREKAAPAETARAEGEAEPKPERADGRDAQGRFAAKDGQAQPAPAQAAQTPPQGQPQATAFAPPPGWSPQAKAQFGQLPPEVQQAVAAREEEVNRGFAVLQNYKGLEQFNDFVKTANTTHAQVMERAIGWERALIADPVGTALHAVAQRGITPQMLVRAITDPAFAQQIRQTTAARQPAPQQQRQPQFSPEDVRKMAREEAERSWTERQINSDISAFFADPKYPHAAALEQDMAFLIGGKRAADLTGAYQMALRLHPELAPAGQSNVPQRSAAAANQARVAAKATVGAPAGGKTPSSATTGNPKTVEEAVRLAVARQRGV